MSSTNSDKFVLETKKSELFHEALGTQNYSFVVVKHYMIYIYIYRFSKFEATVPWNFNRNFTEEK